MSGRLRIMAVLNDEKSRIDLLHRLRRAEGQLRGIQRMIDDGEDCLAIAGQMSAVRKALDSAYVRMTVSVMEQELVERRSEKRGPRADIAPVLESVEALLGKIR